MKKTDLYILMLEDDLMDVELSKQQLNLLEEYNCIINHVTDRETYIRALETTVPDIIISDYRLPRYDGLLALNDLLERNKLIPFIFVTGTMNEEVAADAIKAGAWDYVVKDRLFRLPLAVRGALSLKKEKEIAFQAEEKINELLMAIEQTSAQIVVTDNEGEIRYVNKKFTEVTGFRPDEVIGKKYSFLSSDNDILGTNNELIDKLKKKEVFKGEILSRKKDGTSYWELVSLTPIINPSNEITSFVTVKEDITSRKEMEKDIIEARDEAQRSNKLKEAFLQNMSHEIRTPLNAIVGFSDLIGGSVNIEQQTIKYYSSIISTSSKQLLSIVSDVLTISSIQTGQEKLNIQAVDIYKLYIHMFEHYLPMVNEKKLAFLHSKQTISDSLYTMTDENKLIQILTNLLNNALKFTHEGFIEFSFYLANNNIEFNITDSGIGITKENQDIIFECFRQADPSVHIAYGGTGLGLSISKSFAQMLNGSIQVVSEPEKGSEFILSIPYTPPDSKHTKKDIGQTVSETKPLKILVAEDTYNNYLLLKTLLSKIEADIFHAYNGLEAVNICMDHPEIDIVLMDIKMPIMDGIKAFKEIRNFRKNLPVIALTAYTFDTNSHQLLNLGFTDYLAKPFLEKDIFEKLNKVMQNINM